MTSSWAKHRMRENRNNQYRPEQQQMCREIAREFPEYAVLMEMPIRYTKEDGSHGHAIADILIEVLGVVYRINGEIHNSSGADIRDWEQKEYLERDGWMVIDVDV